MKNQTREESETCLEICLGQRICREVAIPKLENTRNWPAICKCVLPLPRTGTFLSGRWLFNFFLTFESKVRLPQAHRLLEDSPVSFCQMGFPSKQNHVVVCCSVALLCWEWRLHSWSARDSGAKSLIYSAGTAGHLSCNKNKMSLWPRACNLLLNPHFKESYYTRVRLNQTKLQCLRTVAHFQILLYLTTSPLETQLGAEQNDPMII